MATFYEDAGDGYEHENGVYARRSLTCEVEAGHIRVMLGTQEGSFVPTRQQVRLELRGLAAEPERVQIEENPAAWDYDPESKSLVIELSATPEAQTVEIEASGGTERSLM